MSKIIYFDTNFFSYLAKAKTVPEVKEIQRKLIKEELRPILSPINILEILATQNENLREKQIIVCQHLCDQELLAEPESLIIDYICTRTQNEKTSHLILENQFCKSDLSETWKDVHANKNKTLLVNREDIEKFQAFKHLHSYFHAHYSRGKRLPELTLPDFKNKDSVVDEICKATRDLQDNPPEKPRQAILCENRRLVALTILCAGLGPYPQFIDEYWACLEISSIGDRYDYAKNELGFLFEDGPIIGLGSFMGWQATRGVNKGNYFDCLHFNYLPYIELFCTDDQAFHEFSKAYPDASILDRIISRNEVL